MTDVEPLPLNDAEDQKEVLSITYTDLKTEELNDLAAYMAKESLFDTVRKVELNGNSMQGAEASLLCELILSKLTQKSAGITLDFSDNRFGAKGMTAIKDTIKASPALQNCLVHLNLNENLVQNEGARECAFLLRDCKALQVLSLVTNSLNPRGISPLTDGVMLSKSLTKIFIDYNAVGDKGCQTLCDAIAKKGHPTLTELGLSDNAIGDAGAESIANLILGEGNVVARLNLSVNKIGPAGAKAIAVAVATTKNKSLKFLDVACNPFEEEGRRELFCRIQEYKYLDTLDVTSLGVTKTDAELMLEGFAKSAPTVEGGVVKMEWFNNPDLPPALEEQLYNELQEREVKKVEELADAAAREVQRRVQQKQMRQKMVVGGSIVVGLAAIAVTFLLIRKK